jgi:hypothetical protein
MESLSGGLAVIRLPIRLVLLVTFAITATGCIQLTGQRIAWRHDVKADTFTALIFYDGIHDKSDTPREIESSKKRLGEFIDNGNIMLLDWFGVINLGKARSVAPEKLQREPELKPLVQAIEHIRTTPIGHYTESDQIGAAQLMEIRGFSEFLKKLNAHINQKVLAKQIDRDDQAERVRTDELRHKLAERGHAWVAMDGQAIVIDLPFDRDDWALRKADGLSEMMRSMLQNPPEPVQPGEREQWETAKLFTQLFTATPVSIDHRGEIVRFTIGDRARPNVARATIRSSYNTHHVETVKQAVPGSLHDQIVAVASGGEGSKAMGAVYGFGPPEAMMLALAEAAEDGNARALAVLREKARAWNKAGRSPAIRNVESELPINTVNGIRDWHRQMKRYPLEDRHLQLPPKEPAEPDPPMVPDEDPEL